MHQALSNIKYISVQCFFFSIVSLCIPDHHGTVYNIFFLLIYLPQTQIVPTQLSKIRDKGDIC